MLGRVEVTGTPLPHSFSQDVGLTSAISILPSEFLSYFCMNSFIFSPKLSLFDIWGKTKGWGLTVLPGPTGTTDSLTCLVWQWHGAFYAPDLQAQNRAGPTL